MDIALLVLGLLVYPYVFRGQCSGKKEDDTTFFVFPRPFFSSNAKEVERFLSNNIVIQENAPEKAMTSLQDSASSTLPGESATSPGGHETTRLGSYPESSTKPVNVSGGVVWYRWNNSYYAFVDTPQLNWDGAVNNCTSMGAHLVFIESEEENLQVSRLALEVKGMQLHWWIGLDDKDADGVWTWDGVEAVYKNWKPGEPNNLAERCGQFREWNASNAMWNDYVCSKEVGFICEMDIKAAP